MIYDYYKEKGKNNLKGKVIIGAILVLIIAAAVIACSIYLQVIQFDEIGKLSGIYMTNLTYKIAFSVISFIVIFGIIAAMNVFIKKNIKNYLAENHLQSRKLPNLVIALVVAIVGALISKDFFYMKALSFLHSTGFGTTDPLFNKDIGYYVFQRPFYMSIYEFFSTLWIFVIVYTVLYYLTVLLTIFNNTLTLQHLKIKTVIRHNLINVAIFFIIKAFSYKFQKEGLLYSNVVDATGASYVDVNVWMNYFRVIPFLLIFIVLVSFIFIWRGKLRKAAYTIAVFPAVWIIVSIIAAGIQGISVKPNEPTYESQYLKYNIEKTREAYNINKIENFQFSSVLDLTPEVINRNLETKNNIRVVDYQSTLDSNIQLQSITNFYNFHNGDIINYTINGKETPVFISAREIDKNKLPSKTYINTMFKYTHGYGVVINPINRLGPNGQADFILSNLEMNATDKSLKVAEPRVYYGELTRDHVITNPSTSGKLKEIDYDGAKETSYEGTGGVKLGLLSRLLFALNYKDINMIISGNISSDSKLLLNRQILDRAQKAVPFLSIDQDPYIVLTDEGRLKWVIDAYTTTSNYPYSQRAEDYGNFNYIRNSVKIIIDAYDGDVNYYVIDENDPIIKAYQAIYPGVFKKKSEIPQSITKHFRYPELLYKIQTEMLKKYHLTPEEVSTFYTKQGLWEIAKNPVGANANADRGAETTDTADIEPYYNMIKLPNVGKKEELVLMRPFTPSGGKNNMISWLAVRNNFDDYGKLILFNFPSNENVLGPYQVESYINTIDKVSKDMTLWGQGGSRVYKGNLLVIPIESTILYVEPIYLQSTGQSAIPQVKEIIVGYQKGEDFKYGIGANLDEALSQLFTGIIQTPLTTSQTPETKTEADQKLISDIQAKYDALQKQLSELGDMLKGLKK